MAVAAVLLGTVVATSAVNGPPQGAAVEDPRASFTFDAEGETVLVTHYGGDVLAGDHVYVESGARGRLGNFNGTDGSACETNRTSVGPGTTCRVAGGTHDRLYVVWDAGQNRSLILARRGADPTPTPTATVTPSATPQATETTPTPAATATTTPAGTVTATRTATPGAGTGTATPTPVGTAANETTPTPAQTDTGIAES